MEIFTIGVYDTNEKDFFKKLLDNQITLFIDIRRRRGVRGAKYSFVNSKVLQSKLKDLNINYLHLLDLAPTAEIRELQKKQDKEEFIKKSDRTKLSFLFKESYNINILNNFDLEYFVNIEKINKIVLFCVEAESNACHRSLITEKLKNHYSFKVINL